MELRIVHASDTHLKHKSVSIPECDIFIHSGDISATGELHQIEGFMRWFTSQRQAIHRVFIAGNHDRLLDPKFGKRLETRAIIEEYTVNDPNTIYLEDSSVDIMGVKIWGSPWTPWFHGDRWAFNAQRGLDIDSFWQKIPTDTNIVVTHGPVAWHCDMNMDNNYVGCMNLRERIMHIKPLLHLSGHIHEAYGYEYYNDTYYFNGSICNLQYEPMNKPWVMDVDFKEKHIKILNDGYDSRKIEESLSGNSESAID